MTSIETRIEVKRRAREIVRPLIGTLSAAAAVCAVAAPVVAAQTVTVPNAFGSAASSKPLKKSYRVSVNPIALASGRTVKAKITVTSPEASVSGWWSQKTVSAVVRKGVNAGRQTPYSSEGYRCTPVVRGETTSFTCKLRGADVPTIVRLTFAVVYRGDQASG